MDRWIQAKTVVRKHVRCHQDVPLHPEAIAFARRRLCRMNGEAITAAEQGDDGERDEHV